MVWQREQPGGRRVDDDTEEDGRDGDFRLIFRVFFDCLPGYAIPDYPSSFSAENAALPVTWPAAANLREAGDGEEKKCMEDAASDTYVYFYCGWHKALINVLSRLFLNSMWSYFKSGQWCLLESVNLLTALWAPEGNTKYQKAIWLLYIAFIAKKTKHKDMTGVRITV